jgi:PAS domain S-box-containing protein
MRDIALTLTGDTSLDHMLRNCAQLAVHRLDVAFSRIWTIDPSGTMLELKASAGLYSHTNGPHARIPVGQFKIGQIARERRPHLTNAVIGDPKIHDQDWATREQMVAFAGYPLLVGQRLVGVWAMFSRKPISERTLTAVESVAHGLALGIEKCEATLALRESMADTRKLAMVASRTSNAVIITCPNGKIEWVNDSFVSMTEYHLAEVLGRKPGSFLQGPKTDHETINLMRECLRDGRGFKTEILNYSKSGREYWLAIDTQPIRDSAGNITNFVAVESDITSSKLLVAELDRSNKELEQFAYVASHDLQEPLRIISSFAQLLARRYKNQLDADANDFIAFIVDGAVRMQTLINDLLAYSRVGTRGNEKRPVRLDDTLDRALANLRVAIDESHAEFTRDPLPTLMADASQITQLFQNLVGNALKYRAADPPRIHISAQQEGNEWLISIRDNGIGIDPLYLERIFVIFQRLHTREQYPGTGIGLAICQKIVERHGGRIWVDSKQGQGSIFHFTLPIGANGS